MLFLFFSLNTFSQYKYWVSFRDKKNVSFDPYSYFDKRTIEQRRLQNISINDSSDYPVDQFYIEQIKKMAEAVSWPSRWLNGVAVYANTEEINKISECQFVKKVEPMDGYRALAVYSKEPSKQLSSGSLALLNFQTQRMQGDSFKMHNLDGKGIRIAVFDVGFPGVDKHAAFSHLREGKQIIATYDFVERKEDVYKNHWHGTATLSCIGGKLDTVKMGLATGAEFLLARTERALYEPFSEEENWLAAAEWADQHGANIISSSLGYTYHRYFNTQMDGHSSLVARAATIAASKGILVINAAGNDGDNSWRIINTPADADSVLSVAGTDPYSDIHIYFSSFGPSSSGSLKPNVCAVANVIVAKKKGIAEELGTSFSAPLIAGFAACAWQSHRQWSNMELFNQIETSGHLYPYFDYAHGFGIPQADFFTSHKYFAEPTFDFVIINNDIKVILREKYSYPDEEVAMGYRVQRNFYYKVEDKRGTIKKFFVLLADRKEMIGRRGLLPHAVLIVVFDFSTPDFSKIFFR